ncbi:CopD family protein [Streptomyces sp. NPDC020965]|uniref:CopD family protein n=1 Tax=Streptomyces sp. NPDC020965 TaxID=3365105 RepID=UPI0037A4987C
MNPTPGDDHDPALPGPHAHLDSHRASGFPGPDAHPDCHRTFGFPGPDAHPDFRRPSAFPGPHTHRQPHRPSGRSGAALPGSHARPRKGAAAALPVILAAIAALAIAVLGARYAAHGTGELRIPAAGTTTLLRTAVFAALAVHLGELAGTRVAGPGPLPRAWSRAAALTGAAACAGQIVLVAAVNDIDIVTAYGTREGRLLLLMANGFLAAAACATPRRPLLALAPLVLVVVTESFRAHPEPYTPEIGTALTLVHLTAASLWAGGLLHALRVLWTRRANRTAALAALAGYARLAGLPLLLLAVTGTFSTLRRLPLDVVLTSAYGRVLIAKLLLVTVACTLAATARHRMLRARPDAVPPARVELAFLGVILLVSALLTVVPDPHWVSTELGIR